MTPANERVPSEKAREVLYLLEPTRRAHSSGCKGCEDDVALLTRYAAEARLEEAKWWQENDHDPIYLQDPNHSCPGCKRISALEQQLKEGGVAWN